MSCEFYHGLAKRGEIYKYHDTSSACALMMGKSCLWKGHNHIVHPRFNYTLHIY
jgi:hypothetical protein